MRWVRRRMIRGSISKPWKYSAPPIYLSTAAFEEAVRRQSVPAEREWSAAGRPSKEHLQGLLARLWQIACQGKDLIYGGKVGYGLTMPARRCFVHIVTILPGCIRRALDCER
jgi:hypothetical protein